MTKWIETIREAKKKAQGECEKRFGEYLFGEYIKWHGKHKEEDTPTEGQLFKRLKQFIRGMAGGDLDKSFTNGLKLLMNCRNKFKDILQPNWKYGYRITYLKGKEENDLERYFVDLNIEYHKLVKNIQDLIDDYFYSYEEYESDLEDYEYDGEGKKPTKPKPLDLSKFGGPKKVTLGKAKDMRYDIDDIVDSLFWTDARAKEVIQTVSNAPFTYKPHSEVQSWTNTLESALNFAEDSEPGYNSGMQIVIKAKIPNTEAIFNTKFLNKIAKDQLGKVENEIIRVSKKPIKCTAAATEIFQGNLFYVEDLDGMLGEISGQVGEKLLKKHAAIEAKKFK